MIQLYFPPELSNVKIGVLLLQQMMGYDVLYLHVLVIRVQYMTCMAQLEGIVYLDHVIHRNVNGWVRVLYSGWERYI